VSVPRSCDLPDAVSSSGDIVLVFDSASDVVQWSPEHDCMYADGGCAGVKTLRSRPPSGLGMSPECPRNDLRVMLESAAGSRRNTHSPRCGVFVEFVPWPESQAWFTYDFEEQGRV
jgi:hypothetical protein